MGEKKKENIQLDNRCQSLTCKITKYFLNYIE